MLKLDFLDENERNLQRLGLLGDKRLKLGYIFGDDDTSVWVWNPKPPQKCYVATLPPPQALL